MDLIGKISPPSSRQHTFIIVAINYFTKWVKAKTMWIVEQSYVIDFVEENLVHRFGLPETITVVRGPVFMGEQFMNYAKKCGIKTIHSTPYYAQAMNGHAKASNNMIKNVIKKMVDESPCKGHELHML